MGSIVSPRLLASLAAFFPSLCTIQSATVTRDDYGAEVPGWVNLASHVDIPCVISPAGGREAKRADSTITVASHRVMLKGYYPTITTAHRAIVDGRTLDILAVESDSQHVATTLICEAVT